MIDDRLLQRVLVALFDDQLNVAARRLVEAADQEFTEIGRARIAVEQADAQFLAVRRRWASN
jgi:hypothetical protein